MMETYLRHRLATLCLRPVQTFLVEILIMYTANSSNYGGKDGVAVKYIVVQVVPCNSKPKPVDDTATADAGRVLRLSVVDNDEDPDDTAWACLEDQKIVDAESPRTRYIKVRCTIQKYSE